MCEHLSRIRIASLNVRTGAHKRLRHLAQHDRLTRYFVQRVRAIGLNILTRIRLPIAFQPHPRGTQTLFNRVRLGCKFVIVLRRSTQCVDRHIQRRHDDRWGR